MRFTASTAFTAYARGAFRHLHWRCFVRKTTAINTALSAGSWTEVTDDVVDIPEFGTTMEFDLGQFSADSIDMTVRGLQWWTANVLNATASEQIEVKWELKIGLSTSKQASDTVYSFAGFVMKHTIRPDDAADELSFTVISQEYLGNDMPGELVTTQYIEDDVDGSGTDGLVLPAIRGMYVTDAAISSFELDAGRHTVTYINDGTHRARLDEGGYTSVGAGATVLVNAAGDQKVEVYITNTAFLPSDGEEHQEELIVITSGETLPKTWYKRVSAKTLMGKLFGQIGIDSVTYDTLEFNTHNGSSKISFLDAPPETADIIGTKRMTTDGTNLFISVGRRIYRRTMSTGAYTELAALSSGDSIIKLIYNARNDHLWIFYADSGGNGYVRRLAVGTLTLSSAQAVNALTASVQVIDYNYTGSSYLYQFVYTEASTRDVKYVDGATVGSPTTIFDAATLGDTWQGFAFQKDGNKYIGLAYNTVDYQLHQLSVNGSGAWVDDGITISGLPSYTLAAYHASEDRVYFIDSAGSPDVLKSHPRTSASLTSVLTFDTGESTPELHYANSRVYFTTDISGKLYSAASNTATLLTTTPAVVSSAFAFISPRLYAIDQVGRLYQYHSTLVMYVETARFADRPVRQALNDILNSFTLVGTISTTKAGRTYRRGNDAGTAQTSGQTLTLSTADVEDVSKEVNAYPKFDFVEVSNGVATSSYDGTVFDADRLLQGRKLRVFQEFIPTELLEDLAYYLFQYFNQTRHRYRIRTALVTLFNYEIFDRCTATLTGTKLNETVDGVITGQRLLSNGAMELDVVAPL